MPIYEYVCTHCGEPLEKLQKLSDAPLSDCPACGESALKRKISAAGFRLAGGGWYETDFKSDNRRNLTGEGAASKDASSSSGESSSGGSKSGGESNSSDSASKPKPSGESSSAKTAPKSSSASDG